MNYQRIEVLRNGGAVKRWHTMRTLREQTVADHTFGVMLLISELFPHASPQLYRAALVHDLPEWMTGDIPATAKWKSPELDRILTSMEEEWHRDHHTLVAIGEAEAQMLKWCDMMELILWSVEEIAMGNAMFKPIPWRGMRYLNKLGHPNKDCADLIDSVRNRLHAMNEEE